MIYKGVQKRSGSPLYDIAMIICIRAGGPLYGTAMIICDLEGGPKTVRDPLYDTAMIICKGVQ